MATFRRAAGFIAAILLLALGVGLVVTGNPLGGSLLLGLGLGAGVWQAVQLWRTRPPKQDPYDLSRLWDFDPMDPVDEEALEEEARRLARETTSLYCHQCGHAVPDLFAHCPECGQRLR